jgi:hypothetical protein
MPGDVVCFEPVSDQSGKQQLIAWRARDILDSLEYLAVQALEIVPATAGFSKKALHRFSKGERFATEREMGLAQRTMPGGELVSRAVQSAAPSGRKWPNCPVRHVRAMYVSPGRVDKWPRVRGRRQAPHRVRGTATEPTEVSREENPHDLRAIGQLPIR